MNEPNAARKGDDISERLLKFAVRIVKLSSALPKSPVGKHIALQIARAGTSVGANYEEARAAESGKDFAHKLGISLKELRETKYWLRIIAEAELLPAKRLKNVINESTELSNILGKSLSTFRKRDTARGDRN